MQWRNNSAKKGLKTLNMSFLWKLELNLYPIWEKTFLFVNNVKIRFSNVNVRKLCKVLSGDTSESKDLMSSPRLSYGLLKFSNIVCYLVVYLKNERQPGVTLRFVPLLRSRLYEVRGQKVSIHLSLGLQGPTANQWNEGRTLELLQKLYWINKDIVSVTVFTFV